MKSQTAPFMLKLHSSASQVLSFEHKADEGEDVGFAVGILQCSAVPHRSCPQPVFHVNTKSGAGDRQQMWLI